MCLMCAADQEAAQEKAHSHCRQIPVWQWADGSLEFRPVNQGMTLKVSVAWRFSSSQTLVS